MCLKAQPRLPEVIDRFLNKAIAKTGTLRNYVQWLEIELNDPEPPNHPYWIQRLREDWRQCKGILMFLESRENSTELRSDNELMWFAWRDGDKLLELEKPYIHPAYRKFNEAYKKKHTKENDAT